jgi:hypothetical protein
MTTALASCKGEFKAALTGAELNVEFGKAVAITPTRRV